VAVPGVAVAGDPPRGPDYTPPPNPVAGVSPRTAPLGPRELGARPPHPGVGGKAGRVADGSCTQVQYASTHAATPDQIGAVPHVSPANALLPQHRETR